MEGVGARFGRTSSRYGSATVFTGPVRKWKKKWVSVPPSNSGSNNHSAANRTVNGSNGSSHLLLFQWMPITPSQNKDSGYNGGSNSNDDGNADPKNSSKEDAVATEELPKKKFKYIPIFVLEEQGNDISEQADDEAKPIETDAEADSKNGGYDEKPDINDVPMDENKVPVERQDLNESTLDLSLGLKANESDSRSD